MASQPSAAPEGADRQWFIVGRWQEYEGEARANLLRIIAVGLFYVVELASYYGLRLGVFEMPKEVDLPFHQAVTAIAVAWTGMSLGVFLCLRERFFPGAMKYLTTGCDVALLTALLAVASGPRSPLVVGYFLLIALATLRFSLPLVRFCTVASMLGYLVVLGHARWFRTEEFRIPRYHQVMLLLALALCGVVLGQVIRRVAGLAREYAARLESARDEVPPEGDAPAEGESPLLAPAPGEHRAAYQFGLSTLMLIVTAAAVVLGVFRMHLGVGLALVFLAAPALVGTCTVAVRKRARGQPLTPAGKVGVFVVSLVIVALVVAASIGAFFAVCFASFSSFS